MDVLELSPEAAAERAVEVITEWQTGGEHSTVLEALASIDRALRLEDENWDHLYGKANANEGLDLDELQKLSEEIRIAIVKSPIVKRALRLRLSYTWSKGINLPDTRPPAAVGDEKGKPGPKSADARARELLHERIENPVNQASIFGNAAHEELEGCAFHDGMVFALGDDRTREIRRVPLGDIDGVVTNPDFADEVWAYRRSWQSVDPSGKAVGKQAWYYVDTYTGKKRTQIKNVRVDQSKTMIDMSFNRLVGWPLGIPDAVNVIAWAKLYSEFLKHGYVMSKALATFAFKATAATKKGAENATIKLATATGAGQTAVVPGANDLTPMASAGKGYDFSSGRALAAMVATGVEVSLIHLLSDPGAAGSSYGSASNLDLPTKRAIVSRQRLWEDFYKRVLRYLGATDPEVSFPTLEDPDFFREMQSVLAAFGSGEIHHDEIRPRLLQLAQIAPLHTAPPENVLLPNNSDSWERADIDPKEDPNGGSKSASNGGKVAPSQGSATAVKIGKGPKSNDIRRDGLGESLGWMQTQVLLEELHRRLDDAGMPRAA